MSLPVMLGLVFGSLFGLALIAVGSLHRDDRARLLAAQFEQYGPQRAATPPSTAAGSAQHGVAGTAVAGMGRLLQAGKTEQGLAQRLDLAGISRPPAEWALLGCAAGAALAVLLTLLTGNVPIGVLAGAVGGWLGMRTILSLRISRRRNRFRDQLPDVLQLIAGSLRAGFSLPQALGAVVREDTQPVAGEFSRALAETRVGVDLEVALDGVAARMDSVDLRWTVMAIRIQREVGGNLAEVLRNTVATMRERAYLHRHVRSLSAEGRLSAYVLIALPLLLGAWLFFTDRTYLSVLYTTGLGLLLLAGAGALFVVGVLWMRVAVKVEV